MFGVLPRPLALLFDKFNVFRGLRGRVSPARAGIDPFIEELQADHDGFPRASGDRPSATTPSSGSHMFPPRERGSTRPPETGDARMEVSPARAGIDPRPSTRSRKGFCFPRASGDRPYDEKDRASDFLFPPRERGSTPDTDRPGLRRRVSPARAGIDPTSSARAGLIYCFPRASGDRPAMERDVIISRKFPPRERGSTPDLGNHGRHGLVSPARAGIDPPKSVSRRWKPSFPRASGDRPSSMSSTAPSSTFPRASGDRPDLRPHRGLNLVFPPRERGSTHPFSTRWGMG